MAYPAYPAQPAPSDDALKSRAAALQQRHGFRYPLPQLMAKSFNPK